MDENVERKAVYCSEPNWCSRSQPAAPQGQNVPGVKTFFGSVSPDKSVPEVTRWTDCLFLVHFISKSQTSTNITEDAQGLHLK